MPLRDSFGLGFRRIPAWERREANRNWRSSSPSVTNTTQLKRRRNAKYLLESGLKPETWLSNPVGRFVRPRGFGASPTRLAGPDEIAD